MPKSPKLNIFGNAALFQALWFAAVLGAASGVLWPSVTALAALVLWSMIFGKKIQADIRMAFVGLLVAFSVEPVWMGMNVVSYQLQPGGNYPPVWIVCLWMGFSVSLNHSLRWIKSRPQWAASLGAIASGLSITAAVRLGAVDAPQGILHLLVLYSSLWAILVPAMAWLSGSRQSDEVSSTQTP